MFDIELRVKGRVSIEAQAASESPRDRSVKYAIVLMGPTGAGKSSFIEALSGDRSLSISRDQLEGYTQDVCAYHLEGVVLLDGDSEKEWPLVLFDTPGFTDKKVSEMDIVTKVTRYLSSCGISALIYALLYLVPITDLRLSGTRRRVMDTFKPMVGDTGAQRVTVLTTMWNTIHRGEAKEKANARYEELRNGPWKEILNLGAKMTKFFDTTQESALGVLKTALEEPNCSDFSFPFYEYVHKEKFAPKAPFLPNLVSDVESRVDALQSEDKRLTEEIAQAKEEQEDLLVSVLQDNLKDIQPHLARFTQQLKDLRVAVDEERDMTPFDFSFISDDNRFKHRPRMQSTSRRSTVHSYRFNYTLHVASRLHFYDLGDLVTHIQVISQAHVNQYARICVENLSSKTSTCVLHTEKLTDLCVAASKTVPGTKMQTTCHPHQAEPEVSNANFVTEGGQQTGVITEEPESDDDVSSDFVPSVNRQHDQISKQEMRMRSLSRMRAESGRTLPHRNSHDQVSVSRWIMGPNGNWTQWTEQS